MTGRAPVPDPPTVEEIISRADHPGIRQALFFYSPAAVYKYALDKHWITDAQYREARRQSGSRWNRTGD